MVSPAQAVGSLSHVKEAVQSQGLFLFGQVGLQRLPETAFPNRGQVEGGREGAGDILRSTDGGKGTSEERVETERKWLRA